MIFLSTAYRNKSIVEYAYPEVALSRPGRPHNHKNLDRENQWVEAQFEYFHLFHKSGSKGSMILRPDVVIK